MPKTVDITIIRASIERTRKMIHDQRALISDRSAAGRPVQSLAPVLDQMEGNLRLLGKMRRFLDARERRLPARGRPEVAAGGLSSLGEAPERRSGSD